MADEQQSLKAFLFETKSKADVILGLAHVNGEAKSAIKDLLKISEGYERMMSSSLGVSSDANLLKKRYELAKSELKKSEEQLLKTKNILLSIISEIVSLSAESNNIIKLLGTGSENPVFKSLTKIKQSITKMAETIAESQK